MMKKMSTHKTNKKFLVTAICVATLGAQLSSVMNVQAAVNGQDSSAETGAVANPNSSESSTPSSSSASSGDLNSGLTDTKGDSSTTGDSTDPATDATTDKTNGNNTEDIKTKSTDEETAAPVVVNDPNSTKTVEESGYDDVNSIQAQGHIEVSNDNGTAETMGTQDYKGNSIIENNNSNKLSAVYTITDDVPEANNTWQTGAFPTLYLPSYFTNSNTAANIIVDKGSSQNATEWQDALLKNAGLETTTTNIKYTQGTVNNAQKFYSLADLGSNFDVSKITGIQFIYNYQDSMFTLIPANTTYTIKVPLKVVSNDPYNSNTSKIGVSDMGQSITNDMYDKDYMEFSKDYSDLNLQSMRTTTFRIADKLADVTGQLGAVTEQQSNVKYEGVDPDIQNAMPTIEKGDISYQNFDDAVTDSTESSLYSGSTIIVNNQALEKVAKAVNDKGYSLLMNSDGSIGTGNYVYSTSSKNTVTITPNPNATESTDTSNIAPYIYITLRHLLDTKDSEMTVGDSWNAENSLAAITTPQDKAIPATTADLSSDTKEASRVTTKISDPDGVLDKDGKAIKAGTFEVTYLMQDGNYTISKTATVTVNPTKDPSTNNSGSTSTTGDNGSSTNTTDPTTDPSDPDTPVVSPNEIPDDITGDDPVVSPNEIPDVSELTDNNKSTDSDVQNDPVANSSTSSNNINNNSYASTSNKATGTIVNTAANQNKTSNSPIYTVGSAQSNASGILTGYTPTSTSQSKLAAQFPQTGNAKDSKLQIIGTMIVSMMATVAGFAFSKKRQTKKA
ncbi:hypothetical protein OF389_09955 [Companilactobacillus farciminis]|nr:hypothetical protein [Companilactobacillus farciminis]